MEPLGGARTRSLSAWAMSAGLLLAALATLAIFGAMQDIHSAREAMSRGEEANPALASSFLEGARLAARAAGVVTLGGAAGTLAWLGSQQREGARRVLFSIPAVLVGAILLFPLLAGYTGTLTPADHVSKVPLLLVLTAGLGGLVWGSRAAVAAVAAGGSALVAGAVHAQARGPWWSLPTGAMHELQLEAAWASAGFALLALGLALHARALQRATSLSARSTVATDIPV